MPISVQLAIDIAGGFHLHTGSKHPPIIRRIVNKDLTHRYSTIFTIFFPSSKQENEKSIVYKTGSPNSSLLGW